MQNIWLVTYCILGGHSDSASASSLTYCGGYEAFVIVASVQGSLHATEYYLFDNYYRVEVPCYELGSGGPISQHHCST